MFSPRILPMPTARQSVQMEAEIWKIPVIFKNRKNIGAGTVKVRNDTIRHIVQIELELEHEQPAFYTVQSTTTLEICKLSKYYYSIDDKAWLDGLELPQLAHWLRFKGLKGEEGEDDVELHFAWYLMRDWARLQRLAGFIAGNKEEKSGGENNAKGLLGKFMGKFGGEKRKGRGGAEAGHRVSNLKGEFFMK